ncbi:phosphotransferase [Dactylosporangium sp. NBC_01737]|uniref:phosphotransferase n=1 Tax=Dactylosporangium sp. NBC_01737 TaxID=2975959 RepID=UPI002E120C03|nr:phosphotransferase [Dactylosporangium sp. NBC_01737]
MDDGLDTARALLPGALLETVELLGGSSRSRVRRIRADDRTLIVKEFTGAGEGWAREAAALSVLPPQVRAPRLVAARADPPTVVMSDLGRGPSVADALLGRDPAAAAEAVVSWATTIGVLHRATAGSREAFRDALAGAAPESTVPADLRQSADTLAAHCAGLGVDVPAHALGELRALGTRLDSDGPAALTPADACPDNNVRTGDGLALIDFEGAQWRHVAWDVAYLTAPWPSCWCSWRLPSAVTRRALDAYRAAAAVPDTAAFRADVEAATVGWALMSVSWFLPRALHDETPVAGPSPAAPVRAAPTRRATILHRLDLARRSPVAPALAELAARLHDALTGRWGAVALRVAPAFDPPAGSGGA